MKCCQKIGSFGERLSKIGPELLKWGFIGWEQAKKGGSMGESELIKWVNVATHPLHHFGKCPSPPILDKGIVGIMQINTQRCQFSEFIRNSEFLAIRKKNSEFLKKKKKKNLIFFFFG